jgi:hypothetical protein
VFGNGKTAIKGSANKYLVAISGQTFLTGNPTLRVLDNATRSWDDSFFPAGDARRGNFFPDCDLTNPAANFECGAGVAIFGRQVPALSYDPKTYTGFGNRGYSWEFSTGVQQELMTRVSVDVSYFRRIYGNFLVTDNRAIAPSDYDRFSITVPNNPLLPSAGSVITDLYDLNPSKTIGGTPVDNYQTFASNYGKQIEHWNGVDLNVNARLPHNVTVLGGFSTGRTSADNCEVARKLDNPAQISTAGVLNPESFCHFDTKFLTQVKAIASYTIPKVEVRFAATLQSTPSPQQAIGTQASGAQIGLNAAYVVSNNEVMRTLPRGLSGNRTTVSVNVVPPGVLYGDRVNQLDLRFGKLVKLGRTRAVANFDIYNALNSDTVLTASTAYANFLTPQSLINARFLKFSVQLDF